MTTAEALRVLDTELVMRGAKAHPKLRDALEVVRGRLAPKPRNPKLHPAAKMGGPVLFGQIRGAGRGWDTPTRTSRVHRKQRELYLATFPDPEAQAERIDAMPRSRQFDYDPPARLKDDERRVLVAALLAS